MEIHGIHGVHGNHGIVYGVHSQSLFFIIVYASFHMESMEWYGIVHGVHLEHSMWIP